MRIMRKVTGSKIESASGIEVFSEGRCNRLQSYRGKGPIALRILFVFNRLEPEKGYIENYLPSAMASLGDCVVVVAPHRKSIPTGQLCAHSGSAGHIEVDTNINPRTIRLRSVSVRCLGGIPFMFGLTKLVRQFEPDVVFLPYINPNTILVLVTAARNRHKIAATIGMPVMTSKLPLIERVLYNVFIHLSKVFLEDRIDFFIEFTPQNVVRDIEIFDIGKEKVFFVPLGCDTMTFSRNATTRSETRLENNLQNDDVVFIYAGKLLPEKNTHLLVDAFAMVNAHYANTKLMIIGDGPKEYVAKLIELVKSHRVEKKVIMKRLLPHHDLPRYYNCADVGVWPGSPSITIQEAIACGLPVVLRKCGHTAHLIEYENGYDFESFDELVNRMEVLVRDRGLREEMGNRGRKYAEEHLDWRVIAESIHRILHNTSNTLCRMQRD